MDTDTRRPFNVLLFGFSQVVLIIATIPGFLPKSIKFLAILFVGWISCEIIFTQTTSSKGGNFGLGSAILAQFFRAVDLVLLTPFENLKDLSDKDTSKITERSFGKRALWVLKLYTNPRGIGSSYEPSHLPPRYSPSTPRWKFVVSRISRVIICLFLACVAEVATASNPGANNPGKGMSEAPLHWRALGVASFGLSAVCSMTMTQSALAAIFVGCGLSSPERWPLLFGSFLDAWSIRRFWRRFWHQMLRKCLVSSTARCIDYFFPTRSSKVGIIFCKLARLYLAFFFVGIIHMGGDRMLTGKTSFGAFKFFVLQAVGITIEIFVCFLWHCCLSVKAGRPMESANGMDKGYRDNSDATTGRKSSTANKSGPYPSENLPPMWIRCVGFAWVILWAVYTAAYFMDPVCSENMVDLPRLDLRSLDWFW